jgi:hypothetical protein
MKKTILISFLIIMCTHHLASSQAALLVLVFGDKAATENFFFSLKGGLNISSHPGLDPSDPKPGVHFGLAINKKINDKWYLAPEFIGLSHKGAGNLALTPTGNPEFDSIQLSSGSSERHLNYIDIPLIIRYNLSERFSLEAGPQISFLTKAKDSYIYSVDNDADELAYTNDIKPHLKKVDLSFVIDIGYIISKPRGGKGIEIHARYTPGFLNISNISGESYRNSLFQFSVNFPFILPSD